MFIIMYSDAHDDIIDFKYVSELEKTRKLSQEIKKVRGDKQKDRSLTFGLQKKQPLDASLYQ